MRHIDIIVLTRHLLSLILNFFLFSFSYNKDIDHIFTHPYRKIQAPNRFSRRLHHITWNYFLQKTIDTFDMQCWYTKETKELILL